MGTRVAHGTSEALCEMPGKFSLKSQVRKLTKECLKAFESNQDQKSTSEGKQDPVASPGNDASPVDAATFVRDDSDSCDKGGTSETDGSVGHEMTDGVDSGVEVVRALSSNGSSSTPLQSCGSSLVSWYSETEGDRASDCGSENSKDGKQRTTFCGGKLSLDSSLRSRPGSHKTSDKDLSLSESCSENSSTCDSQNLSQSGRFPDFGRTVSVRLQSGRKANHVKTPVARRADSSTRLSSRDKSQSRSQNNARGSISQCSGVVSDRSGKGRISKPSDVRGTKMDDGRWPSSLHRSQVAESRSRSQAGDQQRAKPQTVNCSAMSSTAAPSNAMTSSFGAGCGKNLMGEHRSSALDKYGTLPRRPKRKCADPNGEPVFGPAALTRSSSVSREPSLNRAATLRRQQSREKEQVSMPTGKCLPPYPKARKSCGKTVIYHEISIQTSVTGEDISNIMSGVFPPSPIMSPSVEKVHKAVQSEGKEILRKMEESYSRQSLELENERRSNERLKAERKNILSRICKILGYSESKLLEEEKLSELERHFQAVGLTVIKQQEELSELRHYKGIMQRDLEKSFAAQKTLLQQQQDMEAEYFELQEFLQAEKTALSESLIDSEAEIERLKKEVARKDELLQQQQEECKHLVRICEQRRQENLSLEAKLSGLEQRSRDVIVQQGAAVSGAAVALSGLGARLDSLVEQLASSCNISDKDLEDVIYHNEVYSNGQSEDNSPASPVARKSFGSVMESPKRGTSFLNAIMGALRSATQSPFGTMKKNSGSNSQTDQSSDSFGLLEPESCLTMEENASSTSHYTDCASCSSHCEMLKYEGCDDTITLVPNTEYGTTPELSRSDSIQNLSAAILARQEIEKIERAMSPDLIIPSEVNSLVDKVIDVDNLLTKLLKVLRIIQMENDVSLEQLEDQRLELSEKLQHEQLSRQKTENHLQKLQYELKDARSQLSARIVQLEQAKMMLNKDARLVIADSQRRFAAIHNAIGTLQSIQEVVDRCPPLAKLQQDLEECTFHGDDVNANAASTNGNINKGVAKRNAPILTTAV